MIEEQVQRFADGYGFGFDEYQLRALRALAGGESVLVAAPTGSGKTVVGEFGVWLARAEGGKAFYTTPLKALSNQKFGDFIALHGARNVGLLTGDNSINPQADVVVMTTEVLRNMIYERSDLLSDLKYVILDEVHYLQDPYRGAVWEEVIIHLPVDVKIVSLSATVSNAEEFADWIQTVRGSTSAIIEERRPVQLEHHYLVNDELFPMFVDSSGELIPNSQIRRIETRAAKAERSRTRTRRRGFVRRPDVVELLDAQEMLPAIYFIFSRKGCEAAVEDCMRQGIRLTVGSERRRIRDYAEMRCEYLSNQDLDVLGYSKWLEALTCGVAAHHAGMIPVFKETVEELFQGGLVKAVFATETLSLGINMPAKSVVIESLTKFTGERHEVMTPGEFTQLTGRAGRRGIDVLGHAVVPRQRDLTFQQIAGLASTRTFPLVSSFAPSYNMATNLVRNYEREEAEHLLNSSFAQYRADKEVVVKERQIERNDAYMASYKEKMACDRGDFAEYWRMRQQHLQLERSVSRWEDTTGREQARSALEIARPGQVFVIATGKKRGPVVIVGREKSRRGEPRLIAVTEDRRIVRVTPRDLTKSPRPVGNLYETKADGMPKRGESIRHVDHETRRKLAAALQSFDIASERAPNAASVDGEDRPEVTGARLKVTSHPCHSCPDRDRHSGWAERASRLERDTDRLRKEVRARSETLSRKFERVLLILEEFGYVRDFALTQKGAVLAHIYNESDLLLAESLAHGWLSNLSPEELAAAVSTFVYESRRPFEVPSPMPTAETRRRHERIEKLGERIKKLERKRGLDLTRGTESGFAATVFRWSKGAQLEDVIGEDSDPGDFIRSCKQTVDLLKQLIEAVDEPSLGKSLRAAVESINRGVIAYTGLL